MTIQQALEIAVQHHQAGRLADAEALYRQILAVEPNNADALHLLGVVALQVGRHDLAVESIRNAVVLDPNNPIANSNLGEAYHALDRLDEAVISYRRALQLSPNFPAAHNKLGNALKDRGQLGEAVQAYRRAIEQKRDYPDAHINLGIALRARGEVDEAIASYRRALELEPHVPAAHNNLGNALKDRGQLDPAIEAYRRALELKPDYAAAHYNLGVALRAQGQFDEAIAAYRRALELNPNSPEAYNNLGNALRDRAQFDQAVDAYRCALELKPDFLEAHNNLGVALKDLGQIDEAVAAYRRSLQLQHDDPAIHSNLIYTLHFHPGHDARTIREEHQRWSRRFGDPVKQFLVPHSNARSQGRRLRVGYVSPDFRDHPVGRYVLPLFESHDRERYDIFCYSGVLEPDSITDRLRALAAGWRNTLGVSDAQLAETIREDEVDVLVDLAMHTAGNRLPLFARQPAPVQMTWLAYPGSTGLPSIGYRLTDARIDPPGSHGGGTARSAEEPVRLPDCWCCYQPTVDSPEVNPLPARSTKRVTFGSMNHVAKVNEGALALWARVLDAVKGSQLLMLSPEGRTRERVLAFFNARGIAPERVDLVGYVPRSEYLRLYHRIDIALDTFPCNGMTTTCDALWMGVPVLTLPGEMPVSRAGLSILSTIGLGEFAASSEDDYVRIATDLAGDLPRLAALRVTLRQQMQSSPLMNAPRFARNVEAAYRSMWQTWCAGQSSACDDSAS